MQIKSASTTCQCIYCDTMSVNPGKTNVNSRIAIIGAGSVGSTCAYSLLLRPITAEILLIDTDTTRLHAEVQDLSDAAFLSDTQVREATPVEAGQCDVIVITAGAKQRPGEARSALIDRNLAILKSVIGSMTPIREDALLLLVSNPVDVLTTFALQMSGLPKGRVIGSGTFLDSVRLRSALAGELEVRFSHVQFLREFIMPRRRLHELLFIPTYLVNMATRRWSVYCFPFSRND
jgi:malate/lactate dehydrogenase